jgi:CRISPR-associated protein Csh1
MFNAINNLASLANEQDENITDYLDYPKSKQCENAVFIEIKKNKYVGIYSEELSEDKLNKYLYPNKRSANGISQTPTIVYETYEKSYIKKIHNWFVNKQDMNEYFKNISEILNNNKEQIKQDLDNKQKEVKKFFLSLIIDGKYIGEIDIFKAFIIDDQEIAKQISDKYGKRSVLEHAYCSICMKKKDKVYGYSSPYPFFNVDNESFAYNFKKSNAVKQFPVCLDCAKKIRGKGSKFLETELSFKDLGYTDYFLIPTFVNPLDVESCKIFVSKIKKHRDDIRNNRNNMPEKFIIGELKGNGNKIFYTLLFFQIQNAKFSILASIEEILPSNLSRLNDAIYYEEKKLEENDICIIRGGKNEKTKEDIKFSFNIIQNLFENEKTIYKNRSKKQFLEILDSLLNIKNIDYGYLIKAFVSKEIQNYRKLFLESFLFLNILFNLGITKGGTQQMSNVDMPVLGEFCEQYKEFFNAPLKKAIFGIGALTEQLAICQSIERNNKSIYKSLRNFKMDSRYIIQKVFADIQSKRQFYQYFPKKFGDALSKEIHLCNMANNETRLSIDEASYLFIAGIHLSKFLKDKYDLKSKLEDTKDDSNQQ